MHRNPSKRLGGGAEGADGIKAHPFFQDIDWEKVKSRKLDVPKPQVNTEYFQQLAVKADENPNQHMKIFEDFDDIEQTIEDPNVEGWSFVNMR